MARNGVGVKSIRTIYPHRKIFPLRVIFDDAHSEDCTLNGTVWTDHDACYDITNEVITVPTIDNCINDQPIESQVELPCHCCGSVDLARSKVSEKIDYISVFCTFCMCRGKPERTDDNAIISWNKRISNIEKDWSDVVDEIVHAHVKFSTDYRSKFRETVIDILKEYDNKHNSGTDIGVVTKEQPIELQQENVSEKLEFVVGELYEDRGGNVYEYIGESKKQHGYSLIFMKIIEDYVVRRNQVGCVISCEQSSHNDIIRKHVPAPKEHEVEFWVNVYPPDSQGYIGRTYSTAKFSINDRDSDCIGCLHIKQTFKEGDGL